MISLTAIGSVVKKHIWSILGCLFSGLGVYILTVFFPQIPEFFRQPKIEVAARIDANNSITFQQRDSVLNFEAGLWSTYEGSFCRARLSRLHFLLILLRADISSLRILKGYRLEGIMCSSNSQKRSQ